MDNKLSISGLPVGVYTLEVDGYLSQTINHAVGVTQEPVKLVYQLFNNTEGEDRWEIYGPYECYDIDDAFCLLTDQLECALSRESNGGEIDEDKINSICDCLKELRDFVRYGKEF